MAKRHKFIIFLPLFLATSSIGLAGCGASEEEKRAQAEIEEALETYNSTLAERIEDCEITLKAVKLAREYDVFYNPENSGHTPEWTRENADKNYVESEEGAQARLEWLRSLPELDEKTALYTIEESTKALTKDGGDPYTHTCKPIIIEHAFENKGLDLNELLKDSQ